MSVSIRDVASRAGVSFKTVSRVVNDEGNVAEATKKKVLDAIEELGYIPNVAAASLSRGKSMKIGLVVGLNVRANFSAALTDCLLRSCQSMGMGLSLFTLDDGDNGNIIQAFKGMHIDGVILDTIAGMNEDLLSELDRDEVPYLVIHPGWNSSKKNVSTVTINDYAGTKAAINYLIELGHKEIGLILGQSGFSHEQNRLRAYKDALTESGLVCSEKLIFQYEKMWESGLKSGILGVNHLISCNENMTAIFCQTDEIALGAISGIWQVGKSVPDDISVVGFDDLSLAAEIEPALTTVRQPLRDVADASVSELIKKINKPGKEIEHIVLDTELIKRDTTKKVN